MTKQNCLKFSASYWGAEVNPNFVILNSFVQDKPKHLYSILHNIFSRGTSITPAQFLLSKIGAVKSNNENSFTISDYSEYDFSRTIKGGGVYGNPALDFFNALQQKLKEKKIAEYIIPECPLFEILQDASVYKNEQVDFYFISSAIVVEIDGKQHNYGEQLLKDNVRTKIFQTAGIELIRIKTEEIYNDLNAVIEKIIRKIIPKNGVVRVIDKKILTEQQIAYMTAIRVSLLLCSLGDSLAGQTAFYISDDEVHFKSIKNAVLYALEDFDIWATNVAKITGEKYDKCINKFIFFTDKQKLNSYSGTKIDLSLFKCYDDECKDGNTIYVRNDYFPYNVNRDFDKTIFSQTKNHFCVRDIDFKYNIDESKKSNFEFILNNISALDEKRERFYFAFKANQFEIIQECLNNGSVIGLLPVGAGKSLCYQLCSLFFGTTLLVSPLRLLMEDQFFQMQSKLGFSNILCINASTKHSVENYAASRSLITIISPERFFNSRFNKALNKHIPKFIVIDEAHCLSEWGHDFRTSYLCLSHILSEKVPNTTNVMALTGTASQKALQDIQNEIGNIVDRKPLAVFAKSMERDNLSVRVIKTTSDEEKFKEISTIISEAKGKVLVFTKTKGSVKSGEMHPYKSACLVLANSMRKRMLNTSTSKIIEWYAGGGDGKKEVLEQFRKNDNQVVFATKAFGMGVDIPDIETTVHYGLPSSVEGLYQEIGRAGRKAGMKANCSILFNKENDSQIEPFFDIDKFDKNKESYIKFVQNNCKRLSELDTNFWFIGNAYLDTKEEISVCIEIGRVIKDAEKSGAESIEYRKLAAAVGSIANKNSEELGTIVEKALYRLFTLGEISMWRVLYTGEDFDNPHYTNIKVSNLTNEEKTERLMAYIGGYEKPEELLDNDFLTRLTYLCNWTFKHFLYNRIKSMHNLYEQCVKFEESSNFMKFLGNFFTYDPLFMRLTQMYVPVDSWLTPLKQKAGVEAAKQQLSRLLEEYDKKTPINYLSGIIRLITNEYDNGDGQRRLKKAIVDLKSFESLERIQLFDETYSMLQATEHKQIFVEEWLGIIDEDVGFIYQKTKNKICEEIIIIKAVQRITKIGEILNDKL